MASGLCPSASHRMAVYRLVAELFLYPESRNREVFAQEQRVLADAPNALRDPVEAFLASPRAEDTDEYLALLELTPPCPLYLGAYLFEEPSTCRGAALSGRNAYLIELNAIYGHFGFALDGGELADFLPAMAEFLALTFDRDAQQDLALRRRFVERHMQPALAPMRRALEKYETPYARLLDALEASLEHELTALVQGVAGAKLDDGAAAAPSQLEPATASPGRRS